MPFKNDVVAVVAVIVLFFIWPLLSLVYWFLRPPSGESAFLTLGGLVCGALMIVAYSHWPWWAMGIIIAVYVVFSALRLLLAFLEMSDEDEEPYEETLYAN